MQIAVILSISFMACGDNEDSEQLQQEEHAKQVGHKKCPDSKHPHMIDLGLPSGTLWACCNVDATAPEDYGGYYAFAEKNEKEYYSQQTYTLIYHGDYHNGEYHNIIQDISKTGYDVAYYKCGSPWHMPTNTQMEELVNNTNAEWSNQNGVLGKKFIGLNGGEIFLPACGIKDPSDKQPKAETEVALYFSSCINEDNSSFCYALYLTVGGQLVQSHTPRFWGCSVRPVCESRDY